MAVSLPLQVLYMNHWNELGLQPGSDRDEIKAAFRKLALKYHPDINPDAAEKFAKVKAAAEALLKEPVHTDPAATRAAQMRRQWAQKAPATGGAGYYNAPTHNHWFTSRKGSVYFSLASLAGGVFIFFGAVYVHGGMYEYNTSKRAAERLAQSNNNRRDQLRELLVMERREQKA